MRQWTILSVIGSSKRGVTARTIIEKLAISRATVYRELRVLVCSPLPVRSETVNGETRYFVDGHPWGRAC